MNIIISRLSTVVIFTLLTVLSWILVHIIAVFGIFLAAAYPIWWLFFPKETVCLICRSKRDGDWCPLCKKTIKKREGLTPRGITSCTLNALIILSLSIISVGIVYGESQLLLRLGFPPASKTVSFVIPSRGQYKIGEIFPMKLEVIGIKTPINAVQADIGFDPSKIEVVDISTKDSFANVFIQKEINNQAGYARLTGGLPNPGFFSDKGNFGTVYFRGKTPGLIKIEFLPTSLVLANDGRGSNVLKDFASVSYLILPEKINQQKGDLQKSVIFSPNVLGANTQNLKNTQITFFNETSVLGAQVSNQASQKKTVNPSNAPLSFFNILGEIDKFILSLYQKLLRLFLIKY